MGQREIAIKGVLNDPSGQRLAERLAKIFRDAGWDVYEYLPDSPPQRERGLIIAAGQCPLPRAGTATYMALKAAGFPIGTRLDGALGPRQSILIAGSSAA